MILSVKYQDNDSISALTGGDELDYQDIDSISSSSRSSISIGDEKAYHDIDSVSTSSKSSSSVGYDLDYQDMASFSILSSSDISATTYYPSTRSRDSPISDDFKDFHAAFLKARRLHSALVSYFSRENIELINILSTTNAAEMTLVSNIYKENYRRELGSLLILENDVKFNNLVIGMVTIPSRYDAKILYEALHASSIDFPALSQVLVGRTNFELYEIKKSYAALSQNSLEYDVNQMLM
jgi:hypothetical protein